MIILPEEQWHPALMNSDLRPQVQTLIPPSEPRMELYPKTTKSGLQPELLGNQGPFI